MDENRAKFVLGLSAQLPASAHGFHQLLLTMGASGVSAAGEFISRCDALNSCSLQPLSVSLEEATSSIARALFIITDSICYSCSASHGLHLALNAISNVAAENAVSPRHAMLMRFFRCLCSTMVDAAQALGVTAYFPDFSDDEEDQELFKRVLKSLNSFSGHGTRGRELDCRWCQRPDRHVRIPAAAPTVLGDSSPAGSISSRNPQASHRGNHLE